MIKNYSKCPLKKRPVPFNFDTSSDINDNEPENLSIRKEYSAIHKNEIDVKKSPSTNCDKISSTTASPVTPSVIVPTPTYPKLSLQPWPFHLPYTTTEFYKTIHHQQHHHHQHLQFSPLRSDLHSPNSSSEGSQSPPPNYLHGRSSSVSPPIREVYRPIGIRYPNVERNSHVIKPEVINSQRFMPYQIPSAYQQPSPAVTYPLNLGHSPVSPTSSSYSDTSSYYSLRSHTPENCSVPEDLSIKHHSISNYLEQDQQPHRNNHQHHHNDDKLINENFNETSPKEKNNNNTQPPRYQCSDCNKSYSTFSGLTKHQQFHCPAAEGNQVKKSFSCKDCDKTYVSLGALKMHIRTHTLPCKCDICGKAFSRPWLLQGHIRTHTGEKPFSCQHCHRAFADRSNLRAHLQTHSDIKKYSCTTCSKTFSRMSLLTKHTEGGCPGVQNVSSTESSSPHSPSHSTTYQHFHQEDSADLHH